jgi:NAD+ synthase (glutamine-hydrolysing)
MCRLVAEKAKEGDEQVLKDARRIVGEEADSDYLPTDPKEFCGLVPFDRCEF